MAHAARMQCRGWLGISASWAVLVACGASPALTPRLEDASAPGDFYHSLVPTKRKCPREVPVLEAAEVGGRAYHEVSAMSATCSPGAPNVCRQQLSERACELHADAVILEPPANGGGTPPGASMQSSVAMSARAVNWDGSN